MPDKNPTEIAEAETIPSFSLKQALKEYIGELDWEVRENANESRAYANFLSFYLDKIIKRKDILSEYLPEKLVEEHLKGEIHIHKLPHSLHIPYCTGFNYQKILLNGLKTPTVISKPAKHLDTAVYHLVNFFFIVAQEWSGATAVSAFDLNLAPFVHYDRLSLKQVKQILQGMLFELNYPSRMGYQCLSEDTKILTPDGWKSYNEVKEGDLIYTFNLQSKKIELKPVRKVFIYKHRGEMYSLKNRTQKQLVTPNHRVVWVNFNDHNRIRYNRVEELARYKSPIPIPTTAYPEFDSRNYPISDEELKLVAWFLAEGSIDTSGGRFRVHIYQSKRANPGKYHEILELLDKLGMKYATHTITTGYSPTNEIRLNAESSKRVLKLIGVKAKKPPKWLYKLSRSQAKLFIETYVKGNGNVEPKSERIRIWTTDKELRDALVAVAILAGYNVSVIEKISKSDISKKKQYQISLTTTKTDYIQRIDKVEYEGVIWSVNTENETVIATREGCVFITGNSPFTNITLMIDMIPGALEGEAIHGGKIVGQFQDYIDEIILVNKALTELYLEGDSKNQPFTFPIPTLTVTDRFDWNGRRWGDLTDTIFEALAKRGTFYILNGYTTDVSAIYSMCCRLTLDMSKVNMNNSLKLAVNPQVKPDGLRGMWAIPDATGSIGVITLNLPRIAARSAGNWSIFISQVYEKMEQGRKILSIWRTTYERNLKIGLMPMTNLYLQHLANHYSTIGIVGLPEAAANLMGYNVWREGSKKEMAEAVKVEKEIVRAIREKTEEFEKTDGYLYNVEEIPAESTAYRLAKLDMERMRHLVESGDALIPTEGGAPFYSNSVVPYYADIPIALRAKWEGEVQQEFTGGVMMHLFLYESPDPKALKRMIRHILTKTKIVYLSITPTISVCRKCGWNNVGIYDQCPKCESQVDWWSRIVGYYRPVRTWNIGKKAEFNIRVQYDGKNQKTIRAMKYRI